MSASPQKRRVLYVLQGLPVPFDRRAWLHATTLAKSGYAVSFICPKARGFDLSREEREGVDIYRYWRPIEGEGKLAFIAEFALVLLRDLPAVAAHRAVRPRLRHPPCLQPAGNLLADGVVLAAVRQECSSGTTATCRPNWPRPNSGPGDGLIMKGLLLFERLTLSRRADRVATNESYKKIAVERGGKSRRGRVHRALGAGAVAISRVRARPGMEAGQAAPDPLSRRDCAAGRGRSSGPRGQGAARPTRPRRFPLRADRRRHRISRRSSPRRRRSASPICAPSPARSATTTSCAASCPRPMSRSTRCRRTAGPTAAR